jgi:hypothetical protein
LGFDDVQIPKIMSSVFCITDVNGPNKHAISSPPSPTTLSSLTLVAQAQLEGFLGLVDFVLNVFLNLFFFFQAERQA